MTATTKRTDMPRHKTLSVRMTTEERIANFPMLGLGRLLDIVRYESDIDVMIAAKAEITRRVEAAR